jgi:hypothetical protein
MFTNQVFLLIIVLDRKNLSERSYNPQDQILVKKESKKLEPKSMKGADEHERVKKHKRKKVALHLGAAPLCKANRLHDLRGHGLSQPRREGDDGRQNHAPCPQRGAKRDGATIVKKSNKIWGFVYDCG